MLKRPVYLRNPDHINAHFLVCFIALTMIRLIQYRVLKYQGIGTINEEGWESGITAERIKEALAAFQADLQPGGLCRLTRPSDDFKLIMESFDVDAELRLPTISDMHKLKYSFDRVVMQGNLQNV